MIDVYLCGELAVNIVFHQCLMFLFFFFSGNVAAEATSFVSPRKQQKSSQHKLYII